MRRSNQEYCFPLNSFVLFLKIISTYFFEINKFKNKMAGTPIVVKNPTSNHEDEGLIPGLCSVG